MSLAEPLCNSRSWYKPHVTTAIALLVVGAALTYSHLQWRGGGGHGGALWTKWWYCQGWPVTCRHIPADHWLQVTSGEVLLGMFKGPDRFDTLALASHNAYQPQKVTLKFRTPVQEVSVFDRKAKAWKKVETNDGSAPVEVDAFAAELVRILR